MEKRGSLMEKTRVDVQGISTRLLQAGSPHASEAVVFLHGNPGSADDWETLIAAIAADRPATAPQTPAPATTSEAPTAAPAASASRPKRALSFDLPDFGETIAPDGFAHTVPGYMAFVEHAMQTLGVERAHLVLHDFGGPIGLVWAAAHADRLASVTLIDTGMLPGYRWHRMARIWRTPVLGEIMQAITFRSGFRRGISAAEPRGLPVEFIDKMYDQYDKRTKRAVLELYRSTSDPGAAASEFAAWMAPKDIPALVIWGEKDSYLPSSYAERQRDAFPSAEVHVVPDSGHWPFVDSVETVQRLLLDFLERVGGREPEID